MLAMLLALGAGCSHASSGAPGPSPTPTLPVTSGDYPAYGYAPDFSWVAGRLVRSAPAGPCDYILFSSRPGDAWGGRLPLISPPSLVDPFPDGDMIVVQGTLDSHALSVCGSPVLVVRSLAEH
jgi:hypothetical protein